MRRSPAIAPPVSRALVPQALVLRVSLFARLLALALVALAIPLAPPAEAQEAGGPEGTLAEVLRLLEADVGETVILRWLEGAEPPEPLGAGDLVALRRAGASEDLILRCLDLAPGTAPAAAVPREDVDRGSREQLTSPAPAPDAPEPTLEPTVFRLSFQPDTVEEEEEWDLFVYLDGALLAWLPSSSSLFGGRSLTLERRLEEGPHVLRLLRERHESKRVDGPWRHRARVAPAVIDFEVEAGRRIQVTVEVHEPRHPIGIAPGPVSWSVRTHDRILREVERQGPVFFEWPALCEEIEANLGEGEKPSRAERSELERCVRWDSLWPGEVPARDEVRRQLEEEGFRPSPVGIVG